jgi:hypothetical protein
MMGGASDPSLSLAGWRPPWKNVVSVKERKILSATHVETLFVQSIAIRWKDRG